MSHSPHVQPITDLQCDYQADVDLLFAWFGPAEPAENIEVEPGIYVRVCREQKKVIGIEVLDCAERFHRDPSTIDKTFAKQLIDEYEGPALEQFKRIMG